MKALRVLVFTFGFVGLVFAFHNCGKIGDAAVVISSVKQAGSGGDTGGGTGGDTGGGTVQIVVQYKKFVVDSLETYYQVPKSVVGVIYFYHGSGGSAASFSSKVESTLWAQAALGRGLAVVFVESLDRTNKRWQPTNNPATNPDLSHIKNVQNYLAVNEGLSNQLPKYGVGMSNGGGFVPYAGYGLKYQAVSVYCAAGYTQVFALADYSIPTLFMMAENDTVVSSNSEIQSNYDYLVKKSVRARLLTNGEKPLTTERLMRIPNLTAADTVAIFQSLVDSGFINSKGVFLKSPKSITQADVASAYTAQFSDVKDQLGAVYAEHQFISDFSTQNLDFFFQ